MGMFGELLTSRGRRPVSPSSCICNKIVMSDEKKRRIWLFDYVYCTERNACQNIDQRRTHSNAETHIAENSYKLTTLCCEARTILLGSCGKV